MKVTLWVAAISIAVPIYAYFGYPILLFLVAAWVQVWRDASYLLFRHDRRQRSDRTPFVSIILAAYNEEAVIERTLRNLLELDYPGDSMEIIVGSDCSDDRTVEIARRFEDRGVRVLDFKDRRGKLSVITDCVREARGDILVLSDANTLIEPTSVSYLIRHFENPTIGVVCGELRFVTPEGSPVEEGFYWRYEITLKSLESRIDSALGANGAIYAIRRDLFPVLPPHLITDDFVIPMKARARGFRVHYDPEAIAHEEVAAGVSDEFRRRIRIGAGNWQALWHCGSLLLPWKGFISLAYWSHKVLRWATPYMLIPAIVANALLLHHPFWRILFGLQMLFYLTAGAGLLLRRMGKRAGPLGTVGYFLAINVALGIGIARGIFGLQKAAWQRTDREAPAGEEGT
jgi:cellulose synthase/poly-beta-1,6-N-acetylglucosamine synthase-like glycosyltransferase